MAHFENFVGGIWHHIFWLLYGRNNIYGTYEWHILALFKEVIYKLYIVKVLIKAKELY